MGPDRPFLTHRTCTTFATNQAFRRTARTISGGGKGQLGYDEAEHLQFKREGILSKNPISERYHVTDSKIDI